MNAETHNIPASAIAKLYGVTTRHITQLALAGQIPSRKIGKVWRFNRAEVDEAFKAQPRSKVLKKESVTR